MAIKLIVGLRNPGSVYEATRHNAGAWFANALVSRLNEVFKTNKKLQGDMAETHIDTYSCRVLLPHSFMNHSGHAVQLAAQFYRIKPNEILIAHDELDLDVGRIKLKTGGGHGGHNGLRDVIRQLGTGDFHRLRLGIGHPGHRDLVHNYVLGKPSAEDRVYLFDAVERAVNHASMIVAGDMPAAMTKING